MTDKAQQAARVRRALAITDEHGIAELAREILDTELGRYLLLEADEGPADNGGPWYSTGDSWEFLLECSDGQEYAADWPAELLVDLDTGDEYPVSPSSEFAGPKPPPSGPGARRRVTDGNQSTEQRFDPPAVETVAQVFGVLDYLLAAHSAGDMSDADVVAGLWELRKRHDAAGED